MEQIIFHIDVNSAYLSWSALSLLEKGSSVDLREIPAIIGGDQERRRGIVLAKSIPAKKYGIQTAEPIVNALRKCPNLTIKPPDHHLYQEKSMELMAFLSDICPEIEQLSVDECFMNYTPVRGQFKTPVEGASYIKDQIRETLGFTVNVGISDKKVLAKMASDFKKPDLVHTLFSYEIKDKMWQLPVSSLYMCGKSSVDTLRKLEIKTIGDLAMADKEIITAHLKSHGQLLWEYANGIDASFVNSEPVEMKGIGNSTTLPEDALTKEASFQTLLWLAESVGGRLRHSQLLAGMVSVEIKYSDFKSVSHQTTLFSPSAATQIIYKTACRLFQELWNGSPIRLLGIRTSKLVSMEEPAQLSLFDFTSDVQTSGSCNLSPEKGRVTAPSGAKLAALDKTMDDIRKKFGEDAVVRGSFLTKKQPSMKPDAKDAKE